ncbi:unnamed protein product [Gordionus sp. m RMFG-2023]
MSLPDLSTAFTKSNCPLCNKLVKVTKLGLLPSHRNQKIKCPQSGLPLITSYPSNPKCLFCPCPRITYSYHSHID